jgi:hypothetical protein
MSGSTTSTRGATSVPLPSFTDSGFVSPPESAVLTGVLADLNSAFGGDLTQALETPQGQLASSNTAVIADRDDQMIQIFHGVDPQYASGRMQDGIARIYFIERNPAQATVVTATCTGVVNTSIPSRSLAQATDGRLYAAITGGVIGINGAVDIQFACTETGAVPCAPGALNKVYRGVVGWDSILNGNAGIIGNNVETRAEFEARRQQQVAKNAVGSIPAIQGSVLSVAGIIDAYTTDNPSNATVVMDGITIPPRSLYVCVAGGSTADVASAIWRKKAPGIPMAGDTTVTVEDNNSGYTPPYPKYNVTFQTARPQTFVIEVRITGSLSVPNTATTLIQTAILGAFAGADGGPRSRIGSKVYASRFYSVVANLGTWAEIVSIKLGSTGTPKATFAASMNGTTMTVTALSQGALAVGQTIVGVGVADNVKIVPGGSGTGGTGTYFLTIPQTIASQQNLAVLPDLDLISAGIAHIPVLSAGNITVTLV